MPEIDVSGVLISPSEIRSLLARGERVTAVDARGRTAFLRGAERVEGDLRAEGRDLAWAEGLRKDAWLLAYCT
ncbi:MAG TPA: hypothetical protein VHC97_07595 [Thermoanaerobaculia bacterium]|jgi:hypothetical protein|nr:hypothetical protein [Thermoanaerobaculia bacterium]